ncbi:HalOD1 output domain-containing protein [Halorussus halobius]|uniref:HalOD1 output domain-containing protein n=1 Tax=Halorussus halobius TaxID=1710537 RepID=UPI0010919CC3|nr:HalOD1 output domain-containing protein [Halorussus halobius]
MNLNERRPTDDGTKAPNQPAVEYERADDETTTRAVVTALSIALDVPETELSPIYDAVDPDALDALFRPDGALTTAVDGRVVFEYGTHRVRVDSDGRVCVY